MKESPDTHVSIGLFVDQLYKMSFVLQFGFDDGRRQIEIILQFQLSSTS